MHIGICKVTLRLPENHNLKGKRRVINSLSSRLQQRFNIAIAEVENNDLWQLATLGIVCVSNSAGHVSQILGQIFHFIAEQSGDYGNYELLNHRQEIIPIN